VGFERSEKACPAAAGQPAGQARRRLATEARHRLWLAGEGGGWFETAPKSCLLFQAGRIIAVTFMPATKFSLSSSFLAG
jgi:hypothetical protein